MTDAITDQIAANALKNQTVSNDGVTVSKFSNADLVQAAKFVGANNALEQIAAGTHWFAGVRMVPPGAGGTSIGDC